MSISTPTRWRAAVADVRLSNHTTTQINTSHRHHPGFTVLLVDTNILLSSLSSIASLVESEQWTVVVPLPVIMELDGLSGGGQGGIGNMKMKMNRNVATTPTPSSMVHLGEAAQAALAYLTSHLRMHSLLLKVQTSCGNYLPTLSVRTEQVDFGSIRSNVGAGGEKSMDDSILKAALWQDEYT
jgi:protein SMG6